MLKPLIVAQSFLTRSKINAWVGVVLLCLVFQGCDSKLTTEQYLQRARQFIEQGNLNTAVIELKNALQASPESGEARWLLGTVYIQLEDGASAEKELRHAQRSGVDSDSIIVPLARALFLQSNYDEITNGLLPLSSLTPDQQAELLAIRGQAYLYQDKIERAQEELDKALNINDQTVTALLGHAKVNIASGDSGAIRAWLERAISVESSNHEAWGLLARLEESSGDMEAAGQAYTKAIEGNIRPLTHLLQRALFRIQLEQFDGAEADLKRLPNNHFAKDYGFGLIKFRQQDYVQAQSLLELALTKRENYAPAVYFLGLSHFMQGHELQADNYLNQFIKLAPRSNSAATTLASLQIRRGDLSQAEAVLSSVLERDAGNEQALQLMAATLLAQGKNSDAIAVYQRLVARNPSSSEVLSKLGLALMAQGDVAIGAAKLEAAIKLAPEEDKPQLALFLGLLSSGDKEKALAAAEKWVTNKPQSSSAVLALGWGLLANGQGLQAENAFERVLELSPGNASATHNLAVLAIQQDDVNGAVKYYQDSLKLNPTHAGIGTSLAQLYVLTGQQDEAIGLLEELWQNDPGHIQSAVMLGQALLRAGDSRRAEQVLAESLKTQPEAPALLLNLGTAQAENGNFSQAVDTFRKLVDRQGDSARNYYLLAQAYYKNGDKKGFTSALEKSYRLNPNVLDSQIAMLGLFLEQKKYSRAQSLVDELLVKFPNNVDVHLQSARLSMAKGKLEDGVKAYQSAHRLAPSRSDILVKFAMAQWQSGEQNAAISTMEAWLKKNPGNRVAAYNLANFYLLGGRKEEARSAFADILTAHPDHVLALNNLASLMRSSDLSQALEYAERAYKLAPQAPAVADTLAMTLLAGKGQEERAIRLLETAVKKAPGNAEISYNFAWALVENGQKNRAITLLKNLANSEGDFPQKQQARKLLADLGM